MIRACHSILQSFCRKKVSISSSIQTRTRMEFNFFLSIYSARRVGNAEVKPGFIPSLFANVPPTIRFCTENQRSKSNRKFCFFITFSFCSLVEQLPLPLRKMMKWKMSTITPNIVKNTVIRSGFRLISGEIDRIFCFIFDDFVSCFRRWWVTFEAKQKIKQIVRFLFDDLHLIQREMIGWGHGQDIWNLFVSKLFVNIRKWENANDFLFVFWKQDNALLF